MGRQCPANHANRAGPGHSHQWRSIGHPKGRRGSCQRFWSGVWSRRYRPTVNPRLDRALRIAAGVLGLVVAVPVTLAVFFLMVIAWVGNETGLWILVPPLAILAAALTVFAVRALRPALATSLSLAILGALELVVVIFLLAASRPVTGGTVTGAAISLLAAGFACWAAFRAYTSRHLPAAPVVMAPRRSAPFSITVRKPANPAPGGKPAGPSSSQTRSKRKK